jgi:hypothetical protein
METLFVEAQVREALMNIWSLGIRRQDAEVAYAAMSCQPGDGAPM